MLILLRRDTPHVNRTVGRRGNTVVRGIGQLVSTVDISAFLDSYKRRQALLFLYVDTFARRWTERPGGSNDIVHVLLR